ncbi:hypothetical protein DUI87_24872 [Hirundo rustica rustica]|uniref:Uncharacterized protein n=1 Tax=Hirundo rustica rustica TaxID=333673 RepID=A0A3M0JCW3_HIRRU|nr:hypothetical protein DUI87_24872 [Hirundo rustica rustica]
MSHIRGEGESSEWKRPGLAFLECLGVDTPDKPVSAANGVAVSPEPGLEGQPPAQSMESLGLGTGAAPGSCRLLECLDHQEKADWMSLFPIRVQQCQDLEDIFRVWWLQAGTDRRLRSRKTLVLCVIQVLGTPIGEDPRSIMPGCKVKRIFNPTLDLPLSGKLGMGNWSSTPAEGLGFE